MTTVEAPLQRAAPVVLLAALLAAGLFTSGCTAEPSVETAPTPKSIAEADSLIDGMAEWAMPLDEYFTFAPELHDYVESLLVGECLNGSGYDWPVPVRDGAFAWPANFNVVGHRLFDRSIAERWGYHDAPAPDEKWVTDQEGFRAYAARYSSDAVFGRAYDDCLTKTQQSETPPRFVEGYNFIAVLKAEAFEEAASDPRVTETHQDWAECVSGVLPGVDKPSAVLEDRARAERFGLWGPTRTAGASTSERETAVKDAECRESSGYTTALYETQRERERLKIDEHVEELDKIADEGRQHEKRLRELFQELAPVTEEDLPR
ncbi:hypothetical protein [Microbacterium paraoxydans]|uniref:hypothetical protein n=1 Tax=Microbacterium paraoxydans TaxID=199592 RepID=UPI003D72B0CF